MTLEGLQEDLPENLFFIKVQIKGLSGLGFADPILGTILAKDFFCKDL
jgi:hypothetical protein